MIRYCNLRIHRPLGPLRKAGMKLGSFSTLTQIACKAERTRTSGRALWPTK